MVSSAMFGQLTEICLRGLSFLIAETGDGLVQSGDISRRLGISSTYLSKAFQPLALNGILRSVRGRNGGWHLAVDPKTTPLARVIEILEPGGRWKRCVIGNSSCADETACPFHHVWKDTVEKFTAILDETMLSGLVDFLPPQMPDKAQA